MKRPNLLALLLSILFGAQSAWAGSLVVPNTFSSGETITHSSFNANFDAIETWAAGNVGTDNITDASIASIDIANGTIVAADVASNTLTTSELGTASVDTDELASNAVTTAKITDANVTTAKLATDAAQVVYTLEEGTMTAGDCSSAITMDVTDTRPSANTVLKQNINPDDTNFADETILVDLMASVECTGNCGQNTQSVNLSCNWDSSNDAWWARNENMKILHGGAQDKPVTLHYKVSYTPDDGDAQDVFCVIWENGSNTSTWDYCARMIVRHIKR